MGTLSLDEQHRLADFTATGQRLQQLDMIWTNHLKQASIPQSDVPTLKKITGEMDQLLVKIHQAAESDVRPIFLAHPDVVEQVYNQLMSQGGLSSEQKSQWEKMVAQHGNVVNLAVDAIGRIPQNEAKERDALAAKMQLIEDGRFTPGDLSTEFYCGYFIGMAVAGGVLGMFTGGLAWVAAGVSAASAGAACGQAGVF